MTSHNDSVVPMRTARLAALSMAWAWGVIAGGIGLNALVKANKQQSFLKKQVPAGTTLDINVNDVFQTGVIVTTLGALIGVLTSIYILAIFLRLRQRTFPTIEWTTLGFSAVWMFACLVPFTHFFATRAAKVRAFIGTVELPQQVIQSVEKSLGTTSVYKELGYLRLGAILPWFTVLFTLIAAIVSFLASRRAKHTHASSAPSHVTQNEKRDVDSVRDKPVV